MMLRNMVKFFGLLCVLESVVVYAPPKKEKKVDLDYALLAEHTSSSEYKAAKIAAQKQAAALAQLQMEAQDAEKFKVFFSYVYKNDLGAVQKFINDSPALVKRIINKKHWMSAVEDLQLASKDCLLYTSPSPRD